MALCLGGKHALLSSWIFSSPHYIEALALALGLQLQVLVWKIVEPLRSED